MPDTDTITISPNVEAGAKLLDEHFGTTTWRADVDQERLSIRSTHDCVLGQLFGDFDLGLEHLEIRGRDASTFFGFDIGPWDMDPDKAFTELTRQWLSVLNQA